MSTFIVKSLFYLFIAIRGYIFIRAQLIDGAQENYISIYHYFCEFVIFSILTIYIRSQKKKFAEEIKIYSDKIKKICIIFLAISIPFLPIIEPKIKLALDCSSIKVSNADRWHRLEQVVFSPDNEIIAVIMDRSELFVLNLNKGNSEKISVDSSANSIALSPNGDYLIIGRNILRKLWEVESDDVGIEILNRKTGIIDKIKKNGFWDNKRIGEALQVVCSPDNIHFAVARGGV